MAGLGRYVRTLLVTGWRAHIVWVVILAIVVAVTAGAIVGYYDTPEARATYIASMDIASELQALTGVSGGLDQVGGIIANELGIIVIPTLAIAGVMLAVGRTRKEEDLGRTDILTAAPVGRFVPLVSATLTVTLSLLASAALITAIMVAFGVPLVGAEAGSAGPPDGGALGYGLALFAYSFFFAGIGFVAGQLADNSRTATTIGIGVFLISYLLRAYLILSSSDAWWLTPVGWFDHVAPFADMNWWPIGLLVGLGLALIALATLMHSRRDIGAGIIRGRPGPERGSRFLGTPAGLTWRLVRGPYLGWFAIALAFALLFGAQTDVWLGVLEESAAIFSDFGFGTGADALTNMTILVIAMIGGAAGIAQMGTFHREERDTRLAFLLSKPLSRTRHFGTALAMAVGSAVVLVIVAGMAYMLAARLSAPDMFDAGPIIHTTLVYAVPAALVTALGGFGVGALGRGPWLGWLVFGVGAAISFLGAAMRLPEWAFNLSVYDAVGALPIEPIQWLGVAVELALTASLLAAAVHGLRTREIVGG